jgi:hypothetical protein
VPANKIRQTALKDELGITDGMSNSTIQAILTMNAKMADYLMYSVL